jgi:hypothetical protein
MARRNAPKRFRLTVRHPDQPRALRMAFVGADAAIGWAREGFEHGATTARVERVDGPDLPRVLIFDAPTGFELPISQWNG